eukprot:tig00020538_g10328.t1
MGRTKEKSEPVDVVFVHPDLGIGGAERLVVDAALGLQRLGHRVRFLTAHHDPRRCFAETADGTLEVEVFGDWIPRHLFRRLHILFAILRMCFVSLVVLWRSVAGWPPLKAEPGRPFRPRTVFCDQVSAVVPMLKLSKCKVVFYCHFPDKLLSARPSLLKRVYRWPFDFLEEITTASAHAVVVNSEFTRTITRDAFPRLARTNLEVLYPAIDTSVRAKPPSTPPTDRLPGPPFLLSLNRFERKKRVEMALEAFAALLKTGKKLPPVKLVIAGGYDKRVAENSEYLEELRARAAALSLPADRVVFAPACTEAEKGYLLGACECVLYTPENEHFGIVPIECMNAGKPVLAADSGGPRESVVHGGTGYLLEGRAEAWAGALAELLGSPARAREMGDKARPAPPRPAPPRPASSRPRLLVSRSWRLGQGPGVPRTPREV